MTIKEEIQLEEYKRTFAEAYKQGFMDAMSVCKTEPQFDKDINVRSKTEPQTEYKKWETKPIKSIGPPSAIPRSNNNCVSVAVAFLDDEPQTDCSWK